MKCRAGYTPAVHTAERETQRGSGNSISCLQGPFELKEPPPGPQSLPEDSDSDSLIGLCIANAWNHLQPYVKQHGKEHVAHGNDMVFCSAGITDHYSAISQAITSHK
ncbi:hypothetical protein ROHU_028657 [Labeo rohita]|uniref:Uncharacterized protein n=1 Tax=Labeo rohita TaxID=84645 RepID=A0A498M0P3_LABRO|nr:hypothetical protein ROHU_028657 [Labeo rohita]